MRKSLNFWQKLYFVQNCKIFDEKYADICVSIQFVKTLFRIHKSEIHVLARRSERTFVSCP